MKNSTRETAIHRLFVAAVVALQVALLTSYFALSDDAWAIIFLVLAPASIVVALYLATPLSIRFRISALAICYISLLVGFASLHFLLFRREPNAYVFADAVALRQIDRTITNAQRIVSDTDGQLEFMRELSAIAPRVYIEVRAGATIQLSSDRSVELRTLVAGDPAVVSHKLFMRSPYQLFVIDGNRFGEPRAVAIRRMANARTLNDFQLGLEQLIAAIGQARAEAIETIAKRRPIWRYFDFVYFSAVTLSTLGYGDIVPATRASRFLVASESTAGVLLIAFAFAFVWPPQEPSDVKKTST